MANDSFLLGTPNGVKTPTNTQLAQLQAFLLEHLTTNLTTFIKSQSKKYLYKNYLGYYYFQKRIGKKLVKFSLKTKDLAKALDLAKYHNQRFLMNEKELEREIRRLKRELRELEDEDDNLNSDNFLENIKEASNSSYTTHIYIEASPDDTPEEIEQERQRLMVLASQNKKCESVIAKDLDTTTLQELIDEYIRVVVKRSVKFVS